MESGEVVAGKKRTNDVVLQISNSDDALFNERESNLVYSNNSQFGFPPNSPIKDSNLELTEVDTIRRRVVSTFATSPSPETAARMSGSSTTPTKPPKIPIEPVSRNKSLTRSVFSKPKSRFVEPVILNDPKLLDEKPQLGVSGSSNLNSPNMRSPSIINKVNDASTPTITARTPLMTPNRDEEDDDEVYKNAILKIGEISGKKWNLMFRIELIAFVCISGLLIASLTFHKLQDTHLWSLELWKYSVLVFVIVCGRMVTEGLMNVLVFLIEKNYLLRKKVLYFIYGLKKSVQLFVWLGLVLSAWGLLISRGVKRSKETTQVLHYITRGLAACLAGSSIWLLKTLLVKMLASSFHVTRYFDRIQDSIFHQYILRTLSGPPLMEQDEWVQKENAGHLNFKNLNKKMEEEEVIDVDKLKRMKQDKVSAWTMKGLINVISGSGLCTISNVIAKVDDEDGEQKDEEITCEWEAKAAAYRISRNVAKPGCKYFDEDDLMRFMKKEEIDHLFSLIEGSTDTRRIKRSSLKKWLVNVYLERKSLAHSLNDTKTAIEELNKIASVIVLLVIIVVWLLLMGFLNTQILLFISSQLLLVVFIFGNAAKTMFEAIIFVFVMHPFDVGDRCVIDGVQMIVEEMNILTTIFLRYDNEKISYPNSVLSTKPISNFYRSPEMSDSVEFAVHVSTSVDQIAALKARVKTYLENKPQHWRPSFSLMVKEIENVNKMKMGLYVNHTINFQNSGDRNSRRSDLVLELKKIFEDLGVEYRLLPQEVRLNNVGSEK